MTKSLENKTVILTGATGGIGSKLAEALADSGAKLILVGKDEKKLQSIRKQLQDTEATFTVDFTQPKSTNKLIEEIAAKYDTVDILINSAGIGVYKCFPEITEEDWADTKLG
ncbi:MAG: SDR family NAD(P)-dependent oxidoreductase [Candidatus Dojkabacteria bacterium]